MDDYVDSSFHRPQEQSSLLYNGNSLYFVAILSSDQISSRQLLLQEPPSFPQPNLLVGLPQHIFGPVDNRNHKQQNWWYGKEIENDLSLLLFGVFGSVFVDHWRHCWLCLDFLLNHEISNLILQKVFPSIL